MRMAAIETLAEEMYQMVAECSGKKNLKPGDLTKAIMAKHADAGRDDCKQALRLLSRRVSVSPFGDRRAVWRRRQDVDFDGHYAGGAPPGARRPRIQKRAGL